MRWEGEEGGVGGNGEEGWVGGEERGGREGGKGTVRGTVKDGKVGGEGVKGMAWRRRRGWGKVGGKGRLEG